MYAESQSIIRAAQPVTYIRGSWLGRAGGGYVLGVRMAARLMVYGILRHVMVVSR